MIHRWKTPAVTNVIHYQLIIDSLCVKKIRRIFNRRYFDFLTLLTRQHLHFFLYTTLDYTFPIIEALYREVYGNEKTLEHVSRYIIDNLRMTYYLRRSSKSFSWNRTEVINLLSSLTYNYEQYLFRAMFEGTQKNNNFFFVMSV